MTRQPRRWIKLFCYERLHGSVSYQLSEAEQSIWDKLLCLAGLCGNDGIIADHDLRPYPREFIIHELHADPEVFEATMKKCIDEGRISEDGQGIRITNWNKYQSEYDRQKQYRHGGQSKDISSKTTEECNAENEARIKAWEQAHPGRTYMEASAPEEEQV